MTLNPNLNFKKHAKIMTKVIKLSLINFKPISHCLSLNSAKIFLHAIVLSHVLLCHLLGSDR